MIENLNFLVNKFKLPIRFLLLKLNNTTKEQKFSFAKCDVFISAQQSVIKINHYKEKEKKTRNKTESYFPTINRFVGIIYYVKQIGSAIILHGLEKTICDDNSVTEKYYWKGNKLL